MFNSHLNKKQLLSACFGNFFEHYDTALFSFLSIFLAPVIFPNHDQMTALLLIYAMIPLGMIARPIGALVFGYIGDNYGRSKALFLTLGGMSIVSACMAISPTFHQAGFVSPLFFCIGRILQNFLASGESMGGAIYLLENTSNEKKDILSSIYNATTIGGILFASGGVSLLAYLQMIDTGWRFLYAIGSLTGLFGYLLRKKMKDDIYEPKKRNNKYSISNLWQTFKDHKTPFLLIAITSGFSYATYSISLIVLNGFIPLVTNLTKTQMTTINTFLLILDFCALPLFGWLSFKYSREKVMLTASITTVVAAIPLFLLLPHISIIGVVLVRIVFVLLGVAFFAPYHAWAQSIVPSHARYLVISLAYSLGSQLLGGPTAALSLWIYQTTDTILCTSFYWLILALISSLAILATVKIQKTLQETRYEFD